MVSYYHLPVSYVYLKASMHVLVASVEGYLTQATAVEENFTSRAREGSANSTARSFVIPSSTKAPKEYENNH